MICTRRSQNRIQAGSRAGTERNGYLSGIDILIDGEASAGKKSRKKG